jgi:competence protein ComEC
MPVVQKQILVLLGALIAGIFFARYFSEMGGPANIILSGALIFLVVLLIVKPLRPGFALVTCLFFIWGFYHTHAVLTPPKGINSLSGYIQKGEVGIRGAVDGSPQYRRQWSRVRVAASEINLDGEWTDVDGVLLLRIRNADFEELPRCGEKIEFISRLKHIRLPRNPGAFDEYLYFAGKGIEAKAYLVGANEIKRLGGPAGGRIRNWLETLRLKIFRHIRTATREPAQGVLLALVLGEKGFIDEDILGDMSAIGTMHLLAISGLHIGIVAFFCFEAFKFILKRSTWLIQVISIQRAAAFLTIFPVILYVYIAGGRIPTVRAAIMIMTYLFAVILGRHRQVFHALVLAAILILSFRPLSLFNASFQLSFAAVWAILVIVPPLYSRFSPRIEGVMIPESLGQKVFRWFIPYILVSLAAFLGVAPIIAFYFKNVSWVSPLANPVIVPIIGAVGVPLGLGGAVVSLLSPAVGHFLLFIEQQMLLLGIWISHLFALVPGVQASVAPPSIMFIFVYYILIAAIWLPVPPRKKIAAGLLCVVVLSAIPAAKYVKGKFRSRLTVHFMSLGNSNAALLKLPQGINVMIDAGGSINSSYDIGKYEVAPFLWSQGVRRVHHMIMTHPDTDHYRGFLYLVRYFRPRHFYLPPVEGELDDYRLLLAELKERNVQLHYVTDDVPPVEIGDVKFSFLNPPRQETYDPSKGNEYSIVTLAEFGKWRMLFTGDVGRKTESRLVSRGAVPALTLLEVPHHGSTNSSSEIFLRAARPEVAVVMNWVYAPDQWRQNAVYRFYSNLGIKILSTGADGAIKIDFSRDGFSTYRYWDRKYRRVNLNERREIFGIKQDGEKRADGF